MSDSKNPLSPHLQIYRWHISSLISITHRISGIINLLALILIFFWLLALSFGENSYELFLLSINKSLIIGLIKPLETLKFLKVFSARLYL